jgi:thymidylate synthase
MALEINGGTADELYHEGLWKLKVCGKLEDSRNGEVLTIQELTELTLYDPRARVVFDAERNANPFFHLFEAVWMFAGREDYQWLMPFNKNYINYAETSGRIHGAYGYRWRHWFRKDQIHEVIRLLKEDPTTRRAVIGMWDPRIDLDEFKDLPCNTHIYFRMIDGKLNMTVCNRSNDFVWGMMGANIVHMTMLQELITIWIGAGLGHYKVISNNCHIYEQHWGLMRTISDDHTYRQSLPLLQPGEHYASFLSDAEKFCADPLPEEESYRTEWFNTVALPMMKLWKYRSIMEAPNIKSDDWRVAGCQWIDRRMK